MHCAGHERRSTAWRCHRFKFSEKRTQDVLRLFCCTGHCLRNILYILLCPAVTLLLIIVNTGIIMRHLKPPGQYLIRLKLTVGLHNFPKGNYVNDNVCKSCASSNLLFLFVLLRLCTESLLWQEGGLMFQRCATLIAAQSSDSSTNSLAQCGCWMLVHHTLSRQLMNKQLRGCTKQPNGKNTLQDIIQSNPNDLQGIICFAHKIIFKCCLQSEIKQKDKWCWMMRSAQRSRAAQLD